MLAERNMASPVPDLKPLDFSIWDVLQERVQGTSHPNMESVKAHIAEAWDTLDEAFIASAYRSISCRRPEAVINANGQWRSHESEVTGDQLLWGPMLIGAPPYQWIVHAYILRTVYT